MAAQRAPPPPLLLLFLAVVLLLFHGCDAHSEYRNELPNLPTVAGSPWQGVGHINREGGGNLNQFGRDFAAAGYSWTQALCRKDSDGDGVSNGAELGDPDCQWKKGDPRPAPGARTISHPGFRSSVPHLLSTSPKADTTLGGAAKAPATAAPPTAPPEEPNADMEVPQGEQVNVNGDPAQQWCAERKAAVSNSRLVGSNQAWLNFRVPPVTVLGAPDVYTCHRFVIPTSIPDHREFVGVKTVLDSGSHLHHMLLMECPADLWFLQDTLKSNDACVMHSGSMFSACERWWVATEASNDYSMCTSPGLVYARAGELRAENKVLVMQIHWVFGRKLQNTSVTLNNTQLQLLHEDPPQGIATEVMATADTTAIYPPSVLQHAEGLIIPGNQPAYTAEYECGRRCTFVPLGGLTGQPVNIAGYTSHGHHYMTGMRMGIKRCPLNRLPDVEWSVTDFQQSVVHPTYDVRDQGIKLYPGDKLYWACTYKTSVTNRTVYGGYGGYVEEMCIMNLHYYPKRANFRGCSAVTPQQGGLSVCAYEGKGVLLRMNQEADRVPIRALVASHATLPLSRHPEPSVGYNGTFIVFWLLAISGWLWLCSFVLGRCRLLGRVHTAYNAQSPAAKRNIPVYILHLLVDTVLLAVWFESLFAGWCGCNDAGPASGRLLGFSLLYIVVVYAIELVWRARISAMLAIHHVATILIIAVLFGELAAELFSVGDAVILLGVSALLEQPTYVALLLQRLLPEGSVHTVRAWRVAVWFWFVSKTGSVVLAAWLIARDWALMPVWVRGMYVAVWGLMFGVQLWSGFIQRTICRNAAKQMTMAQVVEVFEKDDAAKHPLRVDCEAVVDSANSSWSNIKGD